MDARDQAWRTHGLGARAADWLDATPDLFVCLDADLLLLYANRAFETTTGLSFPASTGRPLVDLRPFGEATDGALLLIAAARDGRDATEAELTWRPRGEASAELRHQLQARVERAADGTVARYLLTARDVTRFRETEQFLRDSQAEFRTLADNSPDNIIRYGLDGRATYCNQEIAQRVNTTAGRVVGKLPLESAPPGITGVEEYERAVFEALRSGAPGRVDLTVIQPDGGVATHSVLIRGERAADGRITGALAIGRDVSDLVQARQAAAEREREFRSLAENAGDRIVRWDTSARFVYANPRMLDVLGLPAEQVSGRTTTEVGAGRFGLVAAAVDRVIAGGPAELVEQRFVDRHDLLEHIHQVLCVAEHDARGDLVSVLGVGRDITEAVRQREELERIAHTDLLTGLPNSQALFDRAPAMIEAARRWGRRVGVLLLDLDGFKAVNDTVGHAGGDQVLRAVAERVRAHMRSYDLFVRLGGDEFVIVVGDIDASEHLAAVAEKVLRTLNELPGLPLGRGTRVGASIGVAVYPEDGATIETLVAHADVAMYQAKHAGRGRVEYFREELGAALQRRAAIERALVGPGLADQLALHVQPVFRIGPEQRLAGGEALLRWRHPELGDVLPDEFIPVAEETGAIVPIGRWVLREATTAAARWNRRRPPESEPLVVAVNLSTRQFVLDDVALAVDEELESAGCDPRWLALEITESLLLEDSSSVQGTLRHLRARGVRIAIDDFGTGYSALHYLTRFPIDVLKIDRRFVQGVGAAPEHDELVKALVVLSRTLGLTVVAEGIETREQLDFLVTQRCELGQGYLLGRPVPVSRFEAEHDLGRLLGGPR